MKTKMYPKLYNQMLQYYTTVAQLHNNCKIDIVAMTNNYYKKMCNMINKNQITLDYAMSQYPLD